MKAVPIVLGTRFGRLVIEGFRRSDRNAAFCRCDCGWRGAKNFYKLRIGHTRSCGCFEREEKSRRREKHGESKDGGTPEYKLWLGMLSRCLNKNDLSYPRYGGRGITVCDRWRSYENFLADMGRRPSKSHSLDRYPDNNGNYEPENVRWATLSEQGRNRRNNHILQFGDERLCAAEWSERTGIAAFTILNRLRLGWSVEKALTVPVLRAIVRA